MPRPARLTIRREVIRELSQRALLDVVSGTEISTGYCTSTINCTTG